MALTSEDRFLMDPSAPSAPSDEDVLIANMGEVESRVLEIPEPERTLEQVERSELVGQILDFADMGSGELGAAFRDTVNEYSSTLSKFIERGVSMPAAHPDSERMERKLAAMKKELRLRGYDTGPLGGLA